MPTGPTAVAFSKAEISCADRILAKTWASTFPDRVDEKIALHSLRKVMIQALYDMLKITGKFSDLDLAEFVRWHNKKTSTRAYYATLSMEDCLRMVHDLDEEVLPWDIATVHKPSSLM
mmetsp:Transcript_18195/g.21797  ORF Transcript_18195/g.21797 Transcript_18195/m.21797 type:complete len:118 (+) Transcript_18195:3994-4347(+)